jgi:hypothetical protein
MMGNTLVWVVDATDRLRVDDCRQELSGLLLEEVRMTSSPSIVSTVPQRDPDWLTDVEFVSAPS